MAIAHLEFLVKHIEDTQKLFSKLRSPKIKIPSKDAVENKRSAKKTSPPHQEEEGPTKRAGKTICCNVTTCAFPCWLVVGGCHAVWWERWRRRRQRRWWLNITFIWKTIPFFVTNSVPTRLSCASKGGIKDDFSLFRNSIWAQSSPCAERWPGGKWN